MTLTRHSYAKSIGADGRIYWYTGSARIEPRSARRNGYGSCPGKDFTCPARPKVDSTSDRATTAVVYYGSVSNDLTRDESRLLLTNFAHAIPRKSPLECYRRRRRRWRSNRDSDRASIVRLVGLRDVIVNVNCNPDRVGASSGNPALTATTRAVGG